MIEFITNKPEISLTYDGKGKVTFLCPTPKLRVLYDLKQGDYTITLKKYKEKRSLDANAYLWVLIAKIADKLKTDNDSVYLNLLERYGVYTFVVVKPEVIERIKQEWRLTKELGEVVINGKKGIQIQCFFGSHTYDTKEMSRLIDGAVFEAKELGIDTRTPEEIFLMEQAWGK